MNPKNLQNLSRHQTKLLVKILKKKFLNIYKIIAKIDQEDASNFL